MIQQIRMVIAASTLSFITCLSFSQNSIKTTLKVGDKAPSLNVYKWVKGEPVTEFKKGKIYVVDFGATWCVPCAKAIPHLTKIAEKYKGEVNVVTVFVMEPKQTDKDLSYISSVEKYVAKKGDEMKYNVAVDNPTATTENEWLKGANLNGIPQVFVVDKDGRIAWIGSADETRLNRIVDQVRDQSYSINDAIAGSKMQEETRPSTLNQSKLLFADDNGGDVDFLYRSVLTRYNGEQGLGNHGYVSSRRWIKTPSGNLAKGIQEIGISLLNLYFIAYEDTLSKTVYTRQPMWGWKYNDTIASPNTKTFYGRYWYRPILEVSDKASFYAVTSEIKNRYNYSLVTNQEISATKLQYMMQQDLKGQFGYDVIVEDRLMPCWNLVASDKAKSELTKLSPEGKYGIAQLNDTLYRYHNAVMKDILMKFILAYSYSRLSFNQTPMQEAPFFDATGINGEIAFNISAAQEKAFQDANWDKTLQFLHGLGLDLVKGEKLMKVIIIRDPKQ